MKLTFEQLVKHYEPRHNWRGFDACIFTPRFLTVGEALGLKHAWSLGDETVRGWAAKHAAALLAKESVSKMTADFSDGQVVLVGFTFDTLRRIWSPEWSKKSGTEIVLWDGHHRTAALALREMQGIQDDHPVVIFVGE